MQMIILLFKQHIYQCKHNNCAYQINPMRYDRIRTQVHKAKRNHQLQQRIETRNLNVTYLNSFAISWYTCLRCASPRFSCNRIRCTIVKQPSTPYTRRKIRKVTSPVASTRLPIRNRSIYAIPIEPTSPAKHFAFPFWRKLKKQNTISANTTVTINDCSTKSIVLFSKASGIKDAIA